MLHHIICIVLFTLIFHLGYSDINLPVKEFNKGDCIEKIDELRNNYGLSKIIPQEYELPILVTLSYYPELVDVEIEFIIKKIPTTMMARPKCGFVFKSQKNRTYRIFINNSENKKIRGALLNQLPFNAQIGIIAHELEHIVDFNNKKSISIVGIGITYISKKFRSRFEKATELSVINRGFGWQVYAFSDYLHNKSGVPEKYKEYKRNIYYVPAEILELLKDSGMYVVSNN